MYEEKIDKSKLRKIFCTAFLIRMIMLMFVLIFSETFEEGFVASSTYYDDYRYEQGAEIYAETASRIIDVDAFVSAYASVGDWVGYHFIDNPLDASPAWYWIICIITYLFKTKWAIRVFNVFLASLAIVFIYEFSEIVYGEEAADVTTKFMTFLPYPLIFSCFSYKDQLIMVCTFFLLYIATRYRYYSYFDAKSIFWVVVTSVILLFTRGGLTAVLLGLCVIIAFFKGIQFRLRKRQIIPLILVLLVAVAVMSRSMGTIIYKLQYYFTRHEETLTGTSISFITINSLEQMYKLPFTYIFSMIMPIGLFSRLNSWYSVVANLNIFMTPIAVGSTLFIFNRNKPDKIIYWGCLALYLVSIVTSINIFRHYYSLIPFSIIAFSYQWKHSDRNMKAIIILGSFVFSLLLFIYYGMRG